jgi:hypothetical protein
LCGIADVVGPFTGDGPLVRAVHQSQSQSQCAVGAALDRGRVVGADQIDVGLQLFFVPLVGGRGRALLRREDASAPVFRRLETVAIAQERACAILEPFACESARLSPTRAARLS